MDFNLPERFDLNFVDADGQRHRPITIHRALLGSLERFFGILIEHYAGNFPLWLAPVQVAILPITDRHFEYGRDVTESLVKAGFRAEFDQRNEKVGFKIREAEVNKVPYMLIIGDREVAEQKLSVRHKGEGDLGQMNLSELMTMLKKEIAV